MAKSPAHTRETRWPDTFVERRLVDPRTLIPNPKNARRHPAHQVSALEGSLDELGWIDEPTVNTLTGRLTDGHARVELAIAQGEALIPVTYRAIPDEAKALAYKDPIGALAETNRDALDALLRDVATGNESIQQMLDDLAESAGIPEGAGVQPGDDDLPDIPEDGPTRVQAGEIWQAGRHRVACIDSTDSAKILAFIGTQTVAMVWADPPYGMDLDTDFTTMGPWVGTDSMTHTTGNKYAAVLGDDKPFNPAPLLEVFADCPEHFWWGADYYADRIPDRLKGAWLVWDKRLEESADKMFGSCFELCWSKAHHKREIARIKWAGIFGMAHEPEKARVHPTQKPTALVVWVFEKYGVVGDIICDPFLGSGSSILAAERTNRTVYGCELSPHYCDVTLARWETATGQTATRIE